MGSSNSYFRRQWRDTILSCMLIALLLGGCVFFSHWLDAAAKGGWTEDLLHRALFRSLNTAAATFWVALVIFLALVWPFKEDQSPAALEWERMLQRAEELFDRQAAARGRKRWWR